MILLFSYAGDVWCYLLTDQPAEMEDRWFCHLVGVLNATSQFFQEYVDGIPSCELRIDLDDPPTYKEFLSKV